MTPANKTLKFNYNGKDCQITFDDYQKVLMDIFIHRYNTIIKRVASTSL